MNRSALVENSSRLSPVSLELLYPFPVHVNIFVMRRYAIHKLLKKKVRREAEKNVQKLSVEIYSVSVHVIPTSERTSIEYAYLRSKVRELILLTLIGNASKR